MMDRASLIAHVCSAVASGDLEGARSLARRDYPFTPMTNAGRKYSERECLRIFRRDGFIDRYSGARLVYPGTLRLLSRLLPEELPRHPSWKVSECHMMYWELFPTIDHVVPVARGGVDDESNCVTTSMLRNQAKSNWTLAELGWTLHEHRPRADWDGQLAWFLRFVAGHQEHLDDPYLRRWHRAATISS
jgi:hypothetical protein